jgi:Sec-independent protein translocase protein TatA
MDNPGLTAACACSLHLCPPHHQYVHPDCTSAVPRFGVECATFAVVGGALLLLVVLFAKKILKAATAAATGVTGSQRQRAKRTQQQQEQQQQQQQQLPPPAAESKAKQKTKDMRHRARTFAFTVLAVLYAPAMNFAFRTLICTTVVGKGELDLSTRSWSTVRRSMVKAHPFYACGTGAGSPALYGTAVYSLAAAVLVVFGLLYPVVTFLTLQSIARGTARREQRWEDTADNSRVWEELVENEYQRGSWYFVHMHMLQAFCLAGSAANFGSNELDSGITSAWGPGVDAAILLVLLAAYTTRQPYAAGSEWKHNMQRLLLFTSLMLAVLGIASTKAADARNDGRASGALDNLVALLSWVVLLLMIATVLKLCVSFWQVVVLEHADLGQRSVLHMTKSFFVGKSFLGKKHPVHVSGVGGVGADGNSGGGERRFSDLRRLDWEDVTHVDEVSGKEPAFFSSVNPLAHDGARHAGDEMQMEGTAVHDDRPVVVADGDDAAQEHGQL